MTDKQLDRTLRSIGKACFLAYYELFSDFSLSDNDVATMLVEREGWDEDTALALRVRGARRIIKVGRGRDALVLADTPRVRKELRKLRGSG